MAGNEQQGTWQRGMGNGGRQLSTFKSHAADLGRLVKRREVELEAAMSAAAIATAAKRLERAKARHKTALDDVRRHSAPADSSPRTEPPLTLAEATTLAAQLTAQRRQAAGGTGRLAIAVVRGRDEGVDAHGRSAYLEFDGATTPHRLTLTCTSRERALAHWDGYTVAADLAAPVAEVA